MKITGWTLVSQTQRPFFIAFLIVFSISLPLFGSPVPGPSRFSTDPFGTANLDISKADNDTKKSSSILWSLQEIYHHQISNSTIARCPFKTSCSSFLISAVERTDIFRGSIAFLDRYFYRENPSAWSNYSYYAGEGNILKLNDDYYLPGNKAK